MEQRDSVPKTRHVADITTKHGRLFGKGHPPSHSPTRKTQAAARLQAQIQRVATHNAGKRGQNAAAHSVDQKGASSPHVRSAEILFYALRNRSVPLIYTMSLAIFHKNEFPCKKRGHLVVIEMLITSQLRPSILRVASIRKRGYPSVF